MPFNAQAFLAQTVEPLATTFMVCPEGEYPFVVDTETDTLNVREVSGTSAKTGKDYLFHVLEVQCVCMDEDIKRQLSRDKVRVRMSINLDIDADGSIASGPNKNVSLGQFREAIGQNRAGWAPSQLLGAGPFMGRVKHVASAKNPGQMFAEISATARIA